MFAQMEENVCILYAVFINLMSLTVWHRWWARLLWSSEGQAEKCQEAWQLLCKGVAEWLCFQKWQVREAEFVFPSSPKVIS